MVPHISTSSRNGSNGDDDLPTFLLSRSQISRTEGSHRMRHTPTQKTINKKYVTLTAKLVEETSWNKLCVDLMGPYQICRKSKQPLILKCVTMIELVTRWFEVTQHSNKRAIIIVNLVETTWLVRYPWPVGINYDRGRELLGHKLKKSLIESEDGIKTNPHPSDNPWVNAIVQ